MSYIRIGTNLWTEIKIAKKMMNCLKMKNSRVRIHMYHFPRILFGVKRE